MKNRKKNITPQKIKRKVSIITTIIVLAYIVIGVNLIPNTGLRLFLILAALGIGSVLALLINSILLRLAGLSDYSEKEQVKTYLSKEKFTEVSYTTSATYTEAQMLTILLKAEGCRFYAKITEDDNIQLIIKDKNDSKVYDAIFTNYLYFTSHFKPKEELYLIDKYFLGGR